MMTVSEEPATAESTFPLPRHVFRKVINMKTLSAPVASLIRGDNSAVCQKRLAFVVVC